jgi:hypothetical protein
LAGVGDVIGVRPAAQPRKLPRAQTADVDDLLAGIQTVVEERTDDLRLLCGSGKGESRVVTWPDLAYGPLSNP